MITVSTTTYDNVQFIISTYAFCLLSDALNDWAF